LCKVGFLNKPSVILYMGDKRATAGKVLLALVSFSILFLSVPGFIIQSGLFGLFLTVAFLIISCVISITILGNRRLYSFLERNFIRALVMAFIFTAASLLYVYSPFIYDGSSSEMGFPFAYLVRSGSTWVRAGIPSEPSTTFYFPSLLFDIVFWFVISTLILGIHDLLRKRKGASHPK
jgi:hypothetical protein